MEMRQICLVKEPPRFQDQIPIFPSPHLRSRKTCKIQNWICEKSDQIFNMTQLKGEFVKSCGFGRYFGIMVAQRSHNHPVSTLLKSL